MSPSQKLALTTRLRLPSNVADADLFRIVMDALDVVEMVNVALEEAADDGDAFTDIGVGSPLANTAKAVFDRVPVDSDEAETDVAKAQAFGKAFLEKLPEATKAVSAAKFAGWVRGRARELLE